MNASLIASLSVILTTTVIGNAFYQKKQFYPSVVYLTKSNASLAVIYVQAFVLVILFGKLVRKIFFGQLRAAEFEHLMERSWYAVTETCLAFTMFRDDLSPKFVALFTLLLFLKSFHWLAEDRVDYMERSPVITWLFHIRIVSLLLLLSLLDCGFIGLAYQSTVSRGASVQLVFGFEYAILLTAVAYVLVKYVLHTVDLQREAPWENKAVHLLHTELLIGFVKVILYMVFTLIMVKIHTLPLFAIRPMYLALRSFKKALSDVILSRRAIHNMNTLYPTVSAEELANTDSVCIICREEMTAAAGAKKLPCNHVFHALCLRSWFQRQQTCPTCRMDILRAPAPAQPPPQQHPQPQPQQQHPQQQQQQQQQPPPPQPNMGGLLPPFVWPFPPPAPAAAGAAPAPPGAGVAPAAQPGAAGFAAPLAPGAQLPAFHFEQFMMLPAMPPPPADLAALTEQQLLALEQHERSGIEARIRCLRDIGTLLDAAVTMMDQYSRAATLSTRSTPTAAGAGVAAGSASAGAGVAAAAGSASAGAGVAAAAGSASAGAGVAAGSASAGAGVAAAAGSASAGADAARATGEAGEGVMAEATAETAAGVTGGAVAGAAGGAVAGATGGAVAGATGGTVAGATGGAVAGATGGSVAGASGRAVAGVAGGAVAGATGGAVAKATGGEVAGATAGAVAGVTGGAVAGATGGAVAGATGGSVAGAAEGAVAGAAGGAVAEAAGGAAVRQITPEASAMARTAIDGLMTEPTQGPERQLTPQEELRRRRVQHFQQQQQQ